jgi:uncharacterized Tic20 family protein
MVRRQPVVDKEAINFLICMFIISPIAAFIFKIWLAIISVEMIAIISLIIIFLLWLCLVWEAEMQKKKKRDAGAA